MAKAKTPTPETPDLQAIYGAALFRIVNHVEAQPLNSLQEVLSTTLDAIGMIAREALGHGPRIDR